MRFGGEMQAVNALGRKRHRAVEAERGHRAFQIVVNRLRHADDAQSLFAQVARDVERPVAADGDERVEPAFPETAQHFVAAINFRERTIRLRHKRLEGIAVIARAQNGAAEVRDVANERARQFYHPAIGIVFGMEQSIESVADAVDFPTLNVRGMDDRMDDGIQSRRVTAAGVDGDSFEGVHGFVHGYWVINGSARQISLAYSVFMDLSFASHLSRRQRRVGQVDPI